MSSYGIGTVLRSERVRQGLSIEDIARKTKISPRFLSSLEDENFDALPGLVFARGFIRQYSNLLNLDTEDLLSKVPRPETGAMPLPDPVQRDRFLVTPHPAESQWDPRWNSAIATVLWIGLGVGATVGAYLYFSRPTTLGVTASRPAPELARTEPSKTTEAPKPASEKAPAAQVETSTSAAATTAPPTSVVPPTAPPPTNKPIQVMVTALEPAWISLTADGKNAFSGILSIGDSKVIDAAVLVRLTAGNAGGVKVSFNGKELEPLGPHGQVRNARFTAAGLQASVPKPPAEGTSVPPPQ